ncbi:MAG: orotate phosphoribosyltransferase [Deltaproteobacteria bacterium]|nr:MAG: orotate phosphoribosyltransferase [Deltaproteobacteria bacterium]
MSDDLRQRLIAMLRERSVRTGTFTLASGRVSDLYVDVRQTSLHPEGSWLIGQLLLKRLDPRAVAIGGMTLGADPLACSATALSTTVGRPVHGFLIRKEPKGHGVGSYVVGREALPDGAPVCMVEDTTTTGGSLLTAIERAVESGLRVVQVMTVVDRQEGAAERLGAAGYQLQALTTRADLVST